MIYQLTECDLANEEWSWIQDYHGLYQISNMGRVKSFHKNEIILKPNLTNKGYFLVSISKHTETKYFLIHRLVALHFVHNPDPTIYTIVNHKKGIKTDNRHHEIEWGTYSSNNQHAYDTGLKVGAYKGKFGKDHNRSIGLIAVHGNEVFQFESRTECGKFLGTTNRLVCKALKHGWNCKGHKLFSL